MSRRVEAKIGLVAILALSMAVGCSSATEYKMETGERTVGAHGEITITEDDYGNQVIDLNVAHLPKPGDMHQRMSTYSVWLMPGEDGFEHYYNIGQIRLGDDREGGLLFTTPFPTFEIKVTAEPAGTRKAPSDEMVLRQRIGE